MRSAADQLAFHEVYQDRLRPMFLNRPEQVLASPRGEHAQVASNVALPRHADEPNPRLAPADAMDPQWRELAAQISAMGVQPRSTHTPVHTAQVKRATDALHPPHKPRRKQQPALSAGDVVSRLERLQARAQPPTKSEVATLLRDVETFLHSVQAPSPSRRTTELVEARTGVGSLHGARHTRRQRGTDTVSPTRRAPSPPSTSASSCCASPDTSPDQCSTQDGESPPAPRSLRGVPSTVTSDATALALWGRQYEAWRDEYAKWYNTYHDAYRAYYGQSPAAPPSHQVAVAAPSRRVSARPAHRTAAPAPSPKPRPPRAAHADIHQRGSTQHMPPTLASRTQRSRSSRDEASFSEGGEGPVLYEPVRTPRRRAPQPSLSASSSRAASTATRSSTTATSYFPHTLRSPSLSVYERKRQAAQQQRPAWRH